MNNLDSTFILIIAAILIAILVVSAYFLLRKKKFTEKEGNTQLEVEQKLEGETQVELIVEPQPEDFELIVEKSSNEEKTIKLLEIPVDSTVEHQHSTKLNINISSKTEKNLLKKLEQFETSKGFLKKDVNLNNLAKQFDTNTKYLSEIIKSYKNKNFNQYLNELRINYLIHELNNNDKVLNTKVSYLASDMGFSSHSSFSTLFTQYVGQSPSEYIKALKASKKEAELK